MTVPAEDTPLPPRGSLDWMAWPEEVEAITDAVRARLVDATTTTKGLVQLAGDLGGTAAAPTVTSGTGHGHTSLQLSDSTSTGRSVITASDAAAARTAIGAGTSNLALGTTATTAKAGNYQPAAANISDSSSVGRAVLTATDAAAARAATGALSQEQGDARYALQSEFDAALAESFRLTATTGMAVTNSTTLTNDADFAFSVTAGLWYQVDAYLLMELATGGSTTTDVKYAWTLPAGSTGYWASHRVGWDQPGVAGTSTGLLTAITAGTGQTLQEGVQGASFRAIFLAGANGTAQLQWAQNTASTAALTRLAGSNMAVEALT